MTNQIEKCLTKIPIFFGNKAVKMEADFTCINYFLAGKHAVEQYLPEEKY
jgi:hypothetical protein